MHRPFLSQVRKIVSSAGKLFSRRMFGPPSIRMRDEIGPYVSRILSDAILFNEIPSPTEKETLRNDFILRRLTEFGYPTSECDELGNVTTIVPAKESTDEHVLLFVGTRCDEFSPLESMARLETDHLHGTGIVESSIPVASLLVLAEYLAHNEIQYDRNVLLLFTAHDPGELDSPPLEGFLNRWRRNISYAAFLRGLDLGSIGDRPLGTCKLSVKLRTPEHGLMAGPSAPSAISSLAGVAARLGGIRWDAQNNTFLNIARIEAGLGFGWLASEGSMDIEAFSPDTAALDVARNAIIATINGVAAETGATVDVSLKSYLPPGNHELNAELGAMVRGVHEKLRITSRPDVIPTTAAILSSQGVPSVTLGLAAGRKSAAEDYVQISSLEQGFRQLLMFLDASAERLAGAVS